MSHNWKAADRKMAPGGGRGIKAALLCHLVNKQKLCLHHRDLTERIRAFPPSSHHSHAADTPSPPVGHLPTFLILKLICVSAAACNSSYCSPSA